MAGALAQIRHFLLLFCSIVLVINQDRIRHQGSTIRMCVVPHNEHRVVALCHFAMGMCTNNVQSTDLPPVIFVLDVKFEFAHFLSQAELPVAHRLEDPIFEP